MRLRRNPRRTLEALVTAGLATVAASSSAQEPPPPPPPVSVPTAPVAPPPPATPPPAAPKAAPRGDAPKAKDAPKDAPKDGEKDAAKEPGKDKPVTPAVNNEGVFRVSGSKGTGKAVKATGKAAPRKPAEQGLVAQWPGFHLTSDGGSEVMVEFSKVLPAPVEHRAKGSITYVFKGARITKHNNSNPLITVHFNTPIAIARLVPKGGDVHLVIELRGGAEALPSTGIRAGTEGAGAQFFAKFAPGHFIDEAAEGDEVPIGGNKKLKVDGTKGEPKGDKKPDTPPSTVPSEPPPATGPKTGPQP